MRTRLLSHQREIHAMRKYHGRSYLEQKIFSLLLASKYGKSCYTDFSTFMLCYSLARCVRDHCSLFMK